MRYSKLVPWTLLLLPCACLVQLALAGCRGPSGSPPGSVAPVQAGAASSVITVPSTSHAAAVASSGSPSEAPPTASVAATTASAPDAAAAKDAGAPSEPRTASPLLDAQGAALPQTSERPSTTSDAFRQRIEAVADAIISGDAAPAYASFFPVLAYAQVKDVAKPERDYKFRLLANFARDVHDYHRQLGRDAAATQFDGVTVSEAQAKWMEPGSEGNKLGYFRVLRSRLHFTHPTGRKQDFELTSLISWRGEWYVVHLHGFE